MYRATRRLTPCERRAWCGVPPFRSRRAYHARGRAVTPTNSRHAPFPAAELAFEPRDGPARRAVPRQALRQQLPRAARRAHRDPGQAVRCGPAVRSESRGRGRVAWLPSGSWAKAAGLARGFFGPDCWQHVTQVKQTSFARDYAGPSSQLAGGVSVPREEDWACLRAPTFPIRCERTWGPGRNRTRREDATTRGRDTPPTTDLLQAMLTPARTSSESCGGPVLPC